MSIEITTNPHLGRFAGFPRDHLFSLIKQGRDFEDAFLKPVIEQYVTKDSVCVDVGANLGYVSVYLAKRAAKVIALEPQPVVYLQLCANLFLNECFNVTPIQCGAFSSSTSFGFASYQSGWVGASDFSDYSAIGSIGSISLQPGAGQMRGERLDSLIKERVDFIKIDAQGADIDAILGAEGLVAAYRPVIVFEYEDDLSKTNYGRVLADLTPFLERHRYDIKSLHGDNYVCVPR